MSDPPHADRVLITGASKGIGRAIALAFGTAGSRLALLGRPSSALDSTVAACEEAGSSVMVVHADVRDETAVAGGVADVTGRWGGLDVLVNNAGVGRYAPFGELSSSEWSDMLAVNVLGVANVTRAVVPIMVAQGSGHIVNIGSIRGSETIPGTTSYAASKFAVAGLSQALQQDLAGTGVLVSLIAPGGVATDFGGVNATDKDERFLDPATVARAVRFVVAEGPHGWIPDLTVLPRP